MNPDAKVPEPVEVRRVLFDRMDEYLTTPVYDREDMEPGCTIAGPAIIEQMDSTSVIPPGWTARTDGFYNIQAAYQGGVKG